MADAEVQEAATESVADSVRAAMTELAAIEEPQEEPAEAAQEPAEGDEPAEVAEQPEQTETAEAAPEGQEEAIDEEPAEEEEPEEVILAPASWNKDDRAVFEKLDRETQQIITRRETERDKITSKTAQELAPLKAVAEEHKDYFRQIGVSPEISFRTLVAAEQSLRFGTPQQKSEALQKIARDYGIPLPSQPGNGVQAQEEAAFIDPEVQALRGEFNEQIGELKREAESRRQAQEAAEEAQASATAQQFFEELQGMNPAENPEIRYINDVMPRFHQMVKVEREEHGPPNVARLKELFSGAAWSVPDVRERMQQDVATRTQTEQKVVKRTVRKQSSSASGGTGSAAHSEAPPNDESVRDTVLRSIAELDRQRGALR